jgi:hypothetical protein
MTKNNKKRLIALIFYHRESCQTRLLYDEFVVVFTIQAPFCGPAIAKSTVM